MMMKEEGIEIFNYWMNNSPEGLMKVLILRLNEDDYSFLSPFKEWERIDLFLKLKMKFSVAVYIRNDWGDEMKITDNGILIDFDDVEDLISLEDGLNDGWIYLRNDFNGEEK